MKPRSVLFRCVAELIQRRLAAVCASYRPELHARSGVEMAPLAGLRLPGASTTM